MKNLEDNINLLFIGDILLFKTKGLSGRLVKLVTKEEYTHSAVYNGNGILIESDFGGVQVNTLKKYEGIEFAVFRKEKTDYKILKHLSHWCRDKVGKGYDYLGVFGLGMYLLGLKHNNLLDNKSRFWCHEFVADSYIHYGLIKSFDKDTRKTTVKDLVSDLKLVIKG